MSRITHFEIPASQPEKSMTFYRDVFGWKFTRFGSEDYWIAETGPSSEPGINGAIMKRRDPMQPMTNAVMVKDLDTCIADIKKAGGTIVVPKTTVGNAGWLAYFTDPDGVIVGIWQVNESGK